jgi:hypothetical protein
MVFLKNLSASLDIADWFLQQDNKFDTIEAFVQNFSDNAPIRNKFINFCIAGKEYMNKDGYINYDMHLPKADKGSYAFGDKVLTYDVTKHLKKLDVKETKSFGTEDALKSDFTSPKPTTSNDFSLD